MDINEVVSELIAHERSRLQPGNQDVPALATTYRLQALEALGTGETETAVAFALLAGAVAAQDNSAAIRDLAEITDHWGRARS